LLIVFGDFGSRALRFLSDVVLVRHFSREIIGQLNLAQQLSIQGIGISTAGLDVIGVKTVAGGQVPPMQIAATVVLLRLALGVVSWCGVAAIAAVVPKYHPVFDYAVLYGMSIVTASLTVGWIPQGQSRMHIVAIAMLATNFCYFSGVWLCTVFGWAPIAVPLILGLSEGSVAIALWVWVRKACGPFLRGLPAREAWRCFQNALPIGGSNYLRLLIQGSDVLILGLYIQAQDLAVYSMNIKLYTLGTALAVIYLGVLMPQLAACEARDPKSVSPVLYSSLKRFLPAGLAGTAVSMALSEFGLRLLYGPAFATGAPALRILVAAWPLHLISGHFRTALIASGKQHFDFVLVATATLIHITLKMLLAPQFGTIGVAAGTFVGELLLVVIAGWAWNRHGARQ
jgi:O-antigen/teichoic acid export membrane protein